MLERNFSWSKQSKTRPPHAWPHRRRRTAALSLGVALRPDQRQFNATVYGWLPSINMDLSFPVNGGGSTADEDGSDILDAELHVHGGLRAQKARGPLDGRDRLDLSASTKKKDVSVGDEDLSRPPRQGRVDHYRRAVDEVGTYRAVDDLDDQMDVLAGVRMVPPGTDRGGNRRGSAPPWLDASGKSNASQTLWDGIVGLKAAPSSVRTTSGSCRTTSTSVPVTAT